MKNVTKLIGMFASQTLLIGLLFKTMSWPYAYILLLLGTFSLCFVYTPLWVYSTLKSSTAASSKLKLKLGLGLATALILGVSVVFKHFALQGSSVLLVIGFAFAILGFLPAWFFGRE